MIRVLIVDDQEMIRVGLRAILDAQPDIEVAGDAEDGFTALGLLDQAAPDVVLLDLRMPGIDGVEVTRRIRGTHSSEALGILILTTFDNDENVLAAVRAGANGFLDKAVTPAELSSAIREVALGGGALSGAAARLLIDQVADTTPLTGDAVLAARFNTLTARERDITTAIAQGGSNEDIAARMFVSPYTVKSHASRAMAKVGARDRAQLVAFAYMSGLPEFRRQQ